MDLCQRYNDLCRLCASYDPVKIDIFSEQGKTRQLSKKIQSCLPFKVEEHDSLPKGLCYNCIYGLESSYDFRCKCIQAAYNLEKYLQKIEENRKVKHDTLNRLHRIRPEVSIFAIPSLNSNMQSDESLVKSTSPVLREESRPNPLDFVEVGVGVENSKTNSSHKFDLNAKMAAKNNDKKRGVNQFGQLSHMFDGKNSQLLDFDGGLSRRKNIAPRRVSRENENVEDSSALLPDSTLATPGLIAVSTMGASSVPGATQPLGYVLAANTSTTAIVVPKLSSTSKGSASNSLSHGDAMSSRSSVSASGGHSIGGDDSNEPSEYEEGHQNNLYSCLLCEKSFSVRTTLNKHFESVHGIEPSDIIPKSSADGTHPLMNRFADEDEAYLAESMVESETVFLCEVCAREFHDKPSLWLHMVHAHREEAAVSCGICLKICCDNITLIEHVNTAHSTDKDVIQRRYSCQVCGRQHDSRQKLLKHATLHTLIDNQGQAIQPEEMILLNNAFAPRECDICHKKFFNDEKLQQHIQNIHKHVSSAQCVMFKCELCDSSHDTRMDRWWHMYHAHSGDNRVSCERPGCGKVFVSQVLKDEHFQTHHDVQGDYTNTCEVCGKMLESRVVFYKHMMNVHPKCLPSICGVCLKIFSTVSELRVHVEAVHAPLDETSVSCCDICGRPYAERSKMLRHRRVHNVNDEVPIPIRRKDDLQCAYCPEEVFTTLESIAEHRRTAHQLFVCDLCPKFYNGTNHLWKHVSKQHKGNPDVTCDICSRTSASKAHLERHKIKYHSDPVEKLMGKSTYIQSSYKCTLCDRTFRIRSLLKKHLKSCKGGRPPPTPKMQPVNGVFPCSKCNKVYEIQNALVKHMKYVHVTHYCDICDVEDEPGFDTKKDLMKHVRDKHAEHPELLCNVDGCKKIFRQKADLKRHKLEHPRGYLSYVCEVCGDFFSNKKKIRIHLQTSHKQDAKFSCAICNGIFVGIQELTEHVHTEHPIVLHKQLTCQICGRSWSIAAKVLDHITKVHGAEYKPCKLCWKIFNKDEEYNDHVENHPPAIEKPPNPVRKSEPKPKKLPSSISKELSDLGVTVNEDGTIKRRAEDNFEPFDSSKRLRKRYACTQCKDSFRFLSELTEHINVTNHSVTDTELDDIHDSLGDNTGKRKMWTEIQRITCGCCEKVWNTKKQLWQHLIRSHPNNSQFACGICLKICNNYQDLSYHLDAHHSNFMKDTQNRFSCYICGHYHNSFVKLDNHRKMHKSAAPPFIQYCCGPCNRWFSSKICFYEHLNDHRCNDPNLHFYMKKSTINNDHDPMVQGIRYTFCTEPSDLELKAEMCSISTIDDEYQQLMETKALEVNESADVAANAFKLVSNNTAVEMDDDDMIGLEDIESEQIDEDEDETNDNENEDMDHDDDENEEDEDENEDDDNDDVELDEEDIEDDEEDSDDEEDEANIDQTEDHTDIKDHNTMFDDSIFVKSEFAKIRLTDEFDRFKTTSTSVNSTYNPGSFSNGTFPLTESVKVEEDDIIDPEPQPQSMYLGEVKNSTKIENERGCLTNGTSK